VNFFSFYLFHGCNYWLQMSIGNWKSCAFCITNHFSSSYGGFHQCLLFNYTKEAKVWIDIWICIVSVLHFDMVSMWGQRFLGSYCGLRDLLFHIFCYVNWVCLWVRWDVCGVWLRPETCVALGRVQLPHKLLGVYSCFLML
jgi:hypothetical protein